jgi:hypothetical protein
MMNSCEKSGKALGQNKLLQQRADLPGPKRVYRKVTEAIEGQKMQYPICPRLSW